MQAYGPAAAQAWRKARPHQGEHPDVQRWRAVVRHVAMAEQIEHDADQAVRHRALKREAQRKGGVAEHRHDQHDEEP